MSKPKYQLNLGTFTAPALKRNQTEVSASPPVRKFAFGYYFGKRNGFSFRDLAEQYAPYLKEVYFPWPGLLSARELQGDPIPLRKTLVEDLKFCRSKGLALDLLVNATCYGDVSFTPAQREDYRGHLKELSSLGLMPEIVTTTSPYLAKITKDFDASVDRRASVNMRLNSTLAMEYVSTEFDSYYICRDIQRDLPTLKVFAEWGKKNGKTLCMLANSGCLRYCPWQTFHETLLSHNFKHALPEIKKLKMPSTLCSGIVADKKFEEILRGSWIRPEDLHRYEPYVSVIKLSTREADRPDLILKAYTSGSFDGDLLQLLDPGFSFFVAPKIFDNKSFPKEWSEGKIAGRCANDCTHCGKCTEVLNTILKRDPTLPDSAAYSVTPTKPIPIPD
jgi:ferredoxin